MKAIMQLFAFLGAAFIIAAGFVYSGLYNVAADERHWTLTERILQFVRTRSIERHARDVMGPNLDDPQLALKGAGQYAEMCVECHLAPGLNDSPTRKGLYPRPPRLSEQDLDPGVAFWVIKHGVKMTGMPAWGASHDDETIWSIVAFLQRLPKLSPDEYRGMIKEAPADTEMHLHEPDAQSTHEQEGRTARH